MLLEFINGGAHLWPFTQLYCDLLVSAVGSIYILHSALSI